ncbi:hypothetical protein HOY82DRAFT_490697 [Tuber indicum]|nr:hypothetical protein HOY82DRAFT_490697 [Tuber indicum]
MGHCGTIGATDKGDDPAEYRFVCGWCAIRICAGCRDELRFQDNRLMDLLRVIRARGGGDGLGDLNSPSELNIKIQPRVPKMGDTQLPADLSAPTLAIGAEELENLSHFGPPNFSGGSTMISRPKTGSPGSETGRPRRRLTEFEEYDGEPCWPPPTRGKRDPTLSQRAELANIEEYPRQIPSSHPPIGSSGVNSQRRPYQRLPGPPQWNQRGPTPQPRDPLIPRGRSPKADSPEPGQESDRESEAPVEPNDGKQTHQHVQLSHQGSPPRQPSPLVQVSPPQEPLSSLQPSPPEHEAIPSSALKVVGQQEVTLTPPPKSPRRKGSPVISMVDVPGMPRQAGVGQPEVILAHIEKTEIKLPRAKQQPTPELGQPQVEKKQETRAKPPLPSPMPQQERTPGLDKPSRSTPSPRPEPAQVTKMGERLEESVFMGNGMPQPVEKAPGSEVVKLEPVPIPMPKPAEPIPAAKQEKSVQSLTKQEKALPEPPKLVSNMIGDPTISKPVTPPKRPVYPTKPEPNIDLSHFNLKPTTTQERYKLPDSMQLPEIDFGGALDTMAITDGLLGRPARAHQKPPAAPIRLEGEEKEGSISGSMKDKKKWRLPGFGKKKVEKK